MRAVRKLNAIVMKKPLICLLSTLLILQACSKDNIDKSSLTGKYRLREIYNPIGIVGSTWTYSLLNPYFLRLKSDSGFILRSDTNVIHPGADTGRYSIQIIPTMDGKDTILRIASFRQYRQFMLHRQGWELVLSDYDNIDHLSFTYLKVSN